MLSEQGASHCRGAVAVVVVIAFEQIGKEEEPEYEEENEQLDDNQRPKLPSYRHGAETIGVEPVYSYRKRGASGVHVGKF